MTNLSWRALALSCRDRLWSCDLRFGDAQLESSYVSSKGRDALRLVFGVDALVALLLLHRLIADVDTAGVSDKGTLQILLAVWISASIACVLATICVAKRKSIVPEVAALGIFVMHVVMVAACSRRNFTAVNSLPMDLLAIVMLTSILAVGAVIRVHLLVGFLCVQLTTWSIAMRTWGTGRSQPAVEMLLLISFDALMLFGAYRYEVLARREFSQDSTIRQQHSQLMEESALARAMQSIVQRLCTLVFRLDGDLKICEHSVALDTFFGRPMLGECFPSVLSDGDTPRVAGGCREALRSAVPQFLPVTLVGVSGGRANAHLIITDTGLASHEQRFVVGVSVDEDMEVPAVQSHVDPVSALEVAEYAGDAAEASEVGTLDTAVIFDDKQPLGQIAALGRREHWWIAPEDLGAPTPLQLLGEGSFGVVALALLHGQAVAAKSIRRRDAGEGSSLQSFCAELRIIRRLRHPHIASFIGASFDGGLDAITLVYEFIAGARLDKYMAHGAPGPSERFAISLQMCAAVCHLHSQRPAVVHGDLKAGNVMIEAGSGGPRAKLIDFGLSRVLSARPGELGHSLAWAAPEVLLGDRRPCTSVDVFGIGWLLHVATTGQHPYGGASGEGLLEALRKMILDKEVLLPSVAPPAPTDDKARELCQACLKFSAAERPSMPEVLERSKSWGSSVALELGTAAASSLMASVDWRTAAGELARSSGLEAGGKVAQVDARVEPGGGITITDAWDLDSGNSGVDIGDIFQDPEGLQALLNSLLVDVRRGARCTPMMQVVAGMSLVPGVLGVVRAVRVCVYYPDATGTVSLKIQPGELEARRSL